MGTDAPTIVFIPVHCAPKKAPCPKCGKLGKRKRTCTREVRTVAFKAVAYLKITYGEYTAQCECCTTFRNTPEGVLPKAHYDNKVRDLVLDRIMKDGMSIERILESLRREFLLELSPGFVYNVLRDRAEELDMSEHRRKVLEHFSGTLWCWSAPHSLVHLKWEFLERLYRSVFSQIVIRGPVLLLSQDALNSFGVA